MNQLKPLLFALLATVAWAISPAAADDFAQRLDLSPLRTLAVQHDQTLKTLDTFARQAIYQITGRETLDGHEAVFTLLDMSLRPQNYINRNIIKVANVPLRQDLLLLSGLDTVEKKRLLHDGTVSLAFLERSDVRDRLANVQAQSVAKSRAIEQVMMAQGAMAEICQLEFHMIPAAIIPPAPVGGDGRWHRPSEMLGAIPELVASLQQQGQVLPSAPAGYQFQQRLLLNFTALEAYLWVSWDKSDAAGVNDAARKLAELMPQFNPAGYPSQARRTAEVLYNHLTMLTIPGAIFYFFAFVLFLMSAQTGLASLRRWALPSMGIGFFIHSLGIVIRWWLVGGIFPPIKNEFESVMFSAWFGALLGLGLELAWSRFRGIFGAAASFVGMLALVAIFAAPYVTGRQIGGEIGQVQGILMSYWLYVHVTMVTASYSLIGMAFLLSCWWLLRYYQDYGTFRRPSADQSSSAAAAGTFLATLDQCNLVVLQLAFWMLGAGIILGAVWADQSWGRPWGWDPKETFALVTWMVYLIAVHVRVVARNKAWWTAVLGFTGFWVMLFNWIGVNFMLVGLHSYA